MSGYSLKQIKKNLLAANFNNFSQIYTYESVSSTNQLARDHITRHPTQNLIVLSQQQTNGRGRLHRHWHSPPGGVYLSLAYHINPPSMKITLLPLLSALAVCITLKQYGLPAVIKWPNDILVQEKKIAGVLLETISQPPSKNHIICGIGINLNNDITLVSATQHIPATSVAKEIHSHIDYLLFVKKLITIYEHFLTLFFNHKYKLLRDSWEKHADTIGKTIRIVNQDQIIEGVAIALNKNGFLIIRKKTGDLAFISTGDCRYLPDVSE